MIGDIPRWFFWGNGDSVYEGRNTLRIFYLDEHPVMVKRFKRANFFQQIAYSFFRKTKAERAFIYAKEFRERGIDTPQEIAFIEEKERGLFTTGYFISEVCPNPPTYPILVDKADFDHQIAKDVAKEIARLHQAGILHGDLNLGNFLYRKEGDHYFFSVIDTNRSKLKNRVPDEDACLKNLSTVTERPDLFKFIAREYIRERDWTNRETELLGKAIRYWKAKLHYLTQRRRLKRLIHKIF